MSAKLEFKTIVVPFDGSDLLELLVPSLEMMPMPRFSFCM